MPEYRHIIFLFLFALLINSCSTYNSGNKYDFESLSDRTTSNSESLDPELVDYKSRSYFISGSSLQQQNKHAEAILDFQQALKYDSNAIIHYSIAKSYKALGRTEQGIESSFKCIEINPDFVNAYDLLAELFLDEYNLDDAKTTMKKAIDIEPVWERKLRLAKLYEINEPLKAIKIYEEYIENDDRLSLLNRLSALYQATGQEEKQLEVLKKAYGKMPTNPVIATDIINSYANDGNYEALDKFILEIDNNLLNEALVLCYSTALNALFNDTTGKAEQYIDNLLDKIDHRFYFEWRLNLLAGYLALKKLDTIKAGKYFETSLVSYDQTPDIPLEIGTFFFLINQSKKGVEIFNEHGRKFPEDFRFPYFSGIGYIELGMIDSAYEATKLAFSIDSNQTEVLIQLAYLEDYMGNHEKAFQHYESVLEIEPGNLMALNNFAYALAINGGSLERSLEMSRKVIETDNNTSAFLDTYGWILHLMGKSVEALPYLERAADLDNENAEVFEHLGDIYLIEGQRMKASEAWEKSLELDPSNEALRQKYEEIIK